jgi:hypothetical protein
MGRESLVLLKRVLTMFAFLAIKRSIQATWQSFSKRYYTRFCPSKDGMDHSLTESGRIVLSEIKGV